jgi:hypothetical protein
MFCWSYIDDFSRELFVRREGVPVVPIAAQELHED